MKKTLGMSVVMFLLGSFVVGSTVMFMNEAKDKDSETEQVASGVSRAKFNELKKEVARLNGEMSKVKDEILVLTARTRRPEPKKTTPLPVPEPTKADLNLVNMAKRLAVLENNVDKISKPLSAMTLAELMEKFNESLMAKDGKTCVAVMGAISKLDPPDFAALAQCYADMHDAKWLGLGRFDRRGYGNAKLYTWALTTSSIGISGEAADAFLQEALSGYRRSERDDKKRVVVISQFLANLPAPKPLTEEQKAQQGGGRGGRRGRGGRGGFGGFFGGGSTDVYRAALSSLTRSREPEAIKALNTVFGNSSNPADVRVTALNALARDKDSVKTVVEQGLKDSNDEVRKAAELLAQKSSSPVTGFLITTVTPDSVAAKAGLVPGQVITAINNQPVTDARSLQRQMGGRGGRRGRRGGGETPAPATPAADLTLTIYDNGATRTVTVKNEGRLGINGQGVKASN